jgi:hypothetical protein
MNVANSKGIPLSMQEKDTLLNEYKKLNYLNVIANDTKDEEVHSEFILNMTLHDIMTSISNAVYELISGLFNPDNWNVESMKSLFFDKDKFAQIGTLLVITSLCLYIIYISN